MKNGLIVSCQALSDEPLCSSFIMSKMALAAKEGGAVGIRANGIDDILAIKKEVELPVIEIIKEKYQNKKAYITPTLKEVKKLIETDVEIIAMDATINQDEDFLKSVLEKYPDQKFMADISTTEEGIRAEKLSFDFIGTTLISYTDHSKGINKFKVLEELITKCNTPIIAEGNFNTPNQAKRAIELGAYAVVVGTAITRPQEITQKFVKAMEL